MASKTNKVRGFVPVKMDKERTFRYNYDAFELIEETLGTPFASLKVEQLRLKELKVIIWAGLVHEDPELKLEDVGPLIDEAESIQYVAEKMNEAVTLSMQGKSQPEKKAKTK